MMRKLLKIVLMATLALVALLLANNSLVGRSLVHAASQGQRKIASRHASAKPNFTGSDGSQTGTASFQGNFTSISAEPGQALVLARQANCSLTFATGSYNIGTSITYMMTGVTGNYERVLHSEAGLATTADVFPSGCAEPAKGIGSRPGVFVGVTKAGVNVFAGIAYSPLTMNNALFILSGTTSYTTNILSLSTASTVATADLNGDGNGDLVVVNGILTTNGSISVLLGNSDGSFQNAVTYPTAGAGTGAAVIDDVNGDGKLDIVTVSNTLGATTQQISVLTGKGDGTFNPAQTFTAPVVPGSTGVPAELIVNLITADLRGIGKKDIIGSNGLVLLGNGDGTFTASPDAAFPYPQASSNYGPNLASGDLNKDGKLDLAVSTGGNVLTYLGKGDGTFTPGSSYSTVNTVGFVAVSDLDGDGNADIYIGDANGGYFRGDESDTNIAYALMGNGNGTFQGAPTFPGAYTGNNLGDVNGDGQLDLITYGTNFTVRLGTPNGPFNSVSTVPDPSNFTINGYTFTGANATASVTSYAVADVNGDGKADLVFVDDSLTAVNPGSGLPITYPNPVYFVALSKGDGTFAAPIEYAFPQIAPAGDFDNTLTLSGLRIADFNHDGHADLIFSYYDIEGATFGGPPVNSYNEGFVVLLGKGDGTFAQQTVLTSTYSSNTAPGNIFNPAQIITTTDLNGDGKPDLLVTNSSGNAVIGFGSQLLEFLGNGDGTFKASTVINTATNPTLIGGASCVLADLNKDSKLDLACLGETSFANGSQAQLAISLGNGDGTFAAPNILNLSGGDTIRNGGLAIADYDGDGNLDIALINPGDISGVYYGKGDGTFTSVPGNGNSYPKDLINLGVLGPAVAIDNKSGKPDILAGSVLLLNLYGVASTNPTLSASTTTLTASATTIATGSSVTFTASTAGAAGTTGTPTGTVTFLDGTTTLGTGTLSSGKATYTTTALSAGAHNITAAYQGDTTFSASTSSAVGITVNAPGTLSTTTSLTATPTSAATGTSIMLAALVSPTSGTTVPTGTVTFNDGSTPIGSASVGSTGSASISTTTLALGTHTITAQYGGVAGFAASTSSAVTVTISAPLPDFSLSITPGSGTETKTIAATATLTITPANGFDTAISFSCSGLPASVTCSFSPATLTPAGAPLNTTVSFSGTTSAKAQPDLGDRQVPFIFAALGFGSWLLARARKLNPLFRRLAILCFASALVSIAGCSSSNHSQPSTVTITAASGATSHTATYSLSTSN
jgi:hypothetical protein